MAAKEVKFGTDARARLHARQRQQAGRVRLERGAQRDRRRGLVDQSVVVVK